MVLRSLEPRRLIRLLAALTGCLALISSASVLASPTPSGGKKAVTIPVNLAVTKDCKVVSGSAGVFTASVKLPAGEYKTPYFLTLGSESVRCTKGVTETVSSQSGALPFIGPGGPSTSGDPDETLTLYYWILPPGSTVITGFGTSKSACPPASVTIPPVTMTSSTTPVVYPVVGCVPAKSNVENGTYAAQVPGIHLSF